ncbi:universal stress protein [Nocardioides lijunqiniae]|uniref:universal stress protein n=1 Tax=Nocardioides lijunqiniae TaxID=2760832 RepID=UPI0018783EAE|nr:universal stress protein [Nocardioides lijunqiniae]
MDISSLPAGAVVAGVDGSDHSHRAVVFAAREAHLAGRPLVLAHGTGLMPNLDPYAVTVLHELEAAGHELVDAAAAEVDRLFPGLPVETVVRRAHPRQALLDLAARASLLVVGSRGHGPLRSVLLGSVSVGLVREAACPVVVVRPHHAGVVRRGVLVGDDGTADSTPVLEAAYRHASSHGLPLTVLHAAVEPAPGGDAPVRMAESVAGFGERYPDVPVQLVVAAGAPAPELLAAADRMDLVVVGRHDRSRVGDLLLGSVATTVVEHATCLVAVLPLARVLLGTGTNGPGPG